MNRLAKPRPADSSGSSFFSRSLSLNPSNVLGSTEAIFSELASCMGVNGLIRATANVEAIGCDSLS